MKKLIWLTTLMVVFLVFIAPLILALAIDMIPTTDQPGYNPDQRLAIYGKRIISQRFISKQDNLTAIGTSIRNPNLKNKKDVILALYDVNNNLLTTSTLNGQNIEDGSFVKFIFEPIVESENKEYIFTLASPGVGAEETIEVFYLDEATGEIKEFVYDEKTYPGGIPLVTFHKPGSKLAVIKEVYFSWLARIFGQSGF